MWQLVLPIERPSSTPVFLQIARAISGDVRRGRLRPGDALPGSRTLARTLGVHRNTVLAAYAELEAEGWLTSTEAKGTFVSREIPDRSAKNSRTREGGATRAGFELADAPELFVAEPYPPTALVLAGGIPDVRLAPLAELARAFRRQLEKRPRIALGYGDVRGRVELRRALATMLKATRGLTVTEDHLLITRGSQMALMLAARTLIAPGDVVAVESFGYRPAWEAFKRAGAELVPIPIDQAGMSIDALTALVATRRVRAIYVTPHHQYPTTVTLSPGRRIALLELAAKERIAIVEDDYDHEFHYDGRPVLPLAGVDRAGVVIYIGSLSKVFAPGLRIGYLFGPENFLDRAIKHRAVLDLSGEPGIECALAELFEDGEVERHAKRARKIYEHRRDVLIAALEKHLEGVLSFEVPSGGLALWCRVQKDADAEAWADRALEKNVAVQVGRRFAFDGRARQHLRLGFAACTEAELREAAKRLASVAEA